MGEDVVRCCRDLAERSAARNASTVDLSTRDISEPILLASAVKVPGRRAEALCPNGSLTAIPCAVISKKLEVRESGLPAIHRVEDIWHPRLVGKGG